jgi:hypothetical protein
MLGGTPKGKIKAPFEAKLHKSLLLDNHAMFNGYSVRPPNDIKEAASDVKTSHKQGPKVLKKRKGYSS